MPDAERHLLGIAVAILKPLREHIDPDTERLGGGTAPDPQHQRATFALLGRLEDLLLDAIG